MFEQASARGSSQEGSSQEGSSHEGSSQEGTSESCLELAEVTGRDQLAKGVLARAKSLATSKAKIKAQDHAPFSQSVELFERARKSERERDTERPKSKLCKVT